MLGTSTSKWMRFCVQQLLHSLWKKKPLIFAIILVSSFIVVAVQYNSVSRQNEKNSASNSGGVGKERSIVSENNNNKNNNNKLDLNSDDNVAKNHRLMLPRRNLSALDTQNNIGKVMADNHNNRFEIDGASDFDKNREELEKYNSNKFQQNANEAFNARENANPSDYNNPSHSKYLNNPRNEFEARDERAQQMVNDKYYVPSFRLVHFDLKGAPPKISYFKQIFPLLKEAGANGILLEYEDMFPYWGYLKPIAASNAYSKDDIKAILDLAKIYNFEVIPLIQTFGHLEFVLKLQEFRHLREVDSIPMALCPSKNESFTFVTNMIDQIMIMHSSTRYLHIGCDEVFHMGYCEKCRNQDRDMIYLNHVTRVAKYVAEKYNVKPIIWDDMLRNMATDRLKESSLGTLVEPMIWTYVRDIYRFIPYPTWMTYAEVFPNLWTASAFKGAFGETLMVPNVKMHLENNEAWLEAMKEQHRNFKSLRGIVLTGWQRYDHLATLCELLPASLPSLIVNLLTISHGRYNSSYVFKAFDRILRCTPSSRYDSTSHRMDVDFENDPNLWQRAANCHFPGFAVFQLTYDVSEAIKRFNEYSYSVTIHKAWMTDYNIRRNMSNPHRVDESLQEHSLVYYRLTALVKQAQDALKAVFDEYTVAEWIEQNIYPYILKMEAIMKNGIELKKAKTWERRPLKPLPDLQRFGVGTSTEN
ncbi:hypothetical protein B4U79_08355 [Dinothrombium tinctorium]|uniref:beta-N-acetylhexosaminidase n=1 Tax=Dinothrombium tinctorium TaxID=1965070 RepID=A0A443QUZ5_9ACAR|nr:hypothetical protein B4U79_08355 [Dinothrombium tinctorium]